MTEGERQPGNESARKQYLRDVGIGAVVTMGSVLHAAYTLGTNPENGQALLGDLLMLAGGRGLIQQGMEGILRLDSGDDDPFNMTRHRNGNRPEQEHKATPDAAPESTEHRTITIFPSPDKPTTPEEIVKKTLFERRTDSAAQAKVNKVLLEGAVEHIPELKAYLENGGRVSVTREWRPRFRPLSRISLTNEGLMLGSVRKGEEEVPLTDERIKLLAGENGAIKALGRLSPQKAIDRVRQRIDPEALKKVGSSESPPPPPQNS